MFQFLPWRYLVKHAARHYGVLDPAPLMAKLRGFAQPSEVAEPIELLRAGIVFHARGLVNAKAIQHNLDWVWPYWVERQFNPADKSFIPRAFSFSHINLTHRNWTAVGQPGLAVYPIVDPRGLVTPLHDGWSLDFWLINDRGDRLLPSKLAEESVVQRMMLDPNLQVVSRFAEAGFELELKTSMDSSGELQTEIEAVSDADGWLAVAVRPYNPEGVQFIHRIEQLSSDCEFRVNREATLRFDQAPDLTRMARYSEGDVYLDLAQGRSRREISCDVGMATAAALFRIQADTPVLRRVSVGLERDIKLASRPTAAAGETWKDAVDGCSGLYIGNHEMRFLYDAAVRTLLLLSADELVPGPYTYRRFWFRDACLMLHPLMLIGQSAKAARITARFPSRQTMAGYFLSQEGEWDSNGQVLWIIARQAELTGIPLSVAMERSMRKGMTWLEKKRLGGNSGTGTAGLLPAGFSAEHLGPNDYYYWDDFWAWAGLESMAHYWSRTGAADDAARATALAGEFAKSIETSIAGIPQGRSKGGIPAAPDRRMDAGAVGSMVADYPLQLFPPAEPRMLQTLEFLMDNCFAQGGFFQEMIHSGINAYLTLDLAQTLLRAGDDRFMDLMRTVAKLATPTGQWPEAIHPGTLGGCMGDGQHGWAAGEWVMMIRNCFVREESDTLIIGSGILPEWRDGSDVFFGPSLTKWGSVTVRLTGERLVLETAWRGDGPPKLRVCVPGFEPLDSTSDVHEFSLKKL
jgi:hypothetical protein